MSAGRPVLRQTQESNRLFLVLMAPKYHENSSIFLSTVAYTVNEEGVRRLSIQNSYACAVFLRSGMASRVKNRAPAIPKLHAPLWKPSPARRD